MAPGISHTSRSASGGDESNQTIELAFLDELLNRGMQDESICQCCNRRHVQLSTLRPCTFATHSGHSFTERGGISDPDHYFACCAQCDERGPHGDSLSEHSSSIDRVNHPNAVITTLSEAVFLTTNAVIWILSAHRRTNHSLGELIGCGDNGAISFAFDGLTLTKAECGHGDAGSKIGEVICELKILVHRADLTDSRPGQCLRWRNVLT